MYEFWVCDFSCVDFDDANFSFKDFRKVLPWFIDDKMQDALPDIVQVTNNMVDWLNENAPGHYYDVSVLKRPGLNISMGPDNVFHKLSYYRVMVKIPDPTTAVTYKLTFGGGDPPLDHDD